MSYLVKYIFRQISNDYLITLDAIPSNRHLLLGISSLILLLLSLLYIGSKKPVVKDRPYSFQGEQGTPSSQINNK